MEAIILVGGYGTRLKPLTYTIPKPLLPLLNRPMVEYIIDKLPVEVTKVILAVNYMKEKIEEYFQKSKRKIEFVLVDEREPLGTGGAIKNCQKELTGRFLVINSDIVCSTDIKELIKFHENKNADITISLYPVEDVTHFGVVAIDNEYRINRFVEKPKKEDAPSNLINAGIYCLNYDILDYIPKGKLTSLEKEIYPKVINDKKRFFGFKFDGYWMDIGRIQNYLDGNKFLLEFYRLNHVVGDGSDINGKIIRSSIGTNCKVDQNTVIRDSIIFDNVKICNSKIDYSIIANSVSIDNCVIQNSVIGENHKLKNRTVVNEIVWERPVPEGYPDKQIGNVVESG